MFTLYRLPVSGYTLGTRVILVILIGFAFYAKGPEVPVLILCMLRCFSPYVSHVVSSLMKRFFCAHGALIALRFMPSIGWLPAMLSSPVFAVSCKRILSEFLGT